MKSARQALDVLGTLLILALMIAAVVFVSVCISELFPPAASWTY